MFQPSPKGHVLYLVEYIEWQNMRGSIHMPARDREVQSSAELPVTVAAENKDSILTISKGQCTEPQKDITRHRVILRTGKREREPVKARVTCQVVTNFGRYTRQIIHHHHHLVHGCGQEFLRRYHKPHIHHLCM